MLMEMPDREEQFSSADSYRLLDELVINYGDELKRIAFLYVNDQAECEDIIQEVFISCFKNLSRFRRDSAYKTWLIRITINKCKDHQRRWSVRKLLYRPSVRPMKTDSSAEENMLQDFDSERFAACLANLSAKHKDVLILFYYQELSMKEISDVLGIGINTVKSRLLRGKNAFRAELERSGYNGSV